VVDAYLSPVLRRYVDQVRGELGDTRLMFMQSNGGLTDAGAFMGKNAILSGPAGGVVGMVKTATEGGFDRLIGFDMGGTSTDVCHYAGEYERAGETEVAGVRLRAPMMHIHTVAAGGGSILHFDGSRFRVGPDSAGADPGPACYRNGGPLTITDCNLMLGKLQPDLFPAVFGERGNQPLDLDLVRTRFEALARRVSAETGTEQSAEQVAQGFLSIAVENMAGAIKKISVQRGYDVSRYTLCSFGGAGGQHACLVADALGISRIFLHPHAGVLSAVGIGLADQRSIVEQSVEKPLDEDLMTELDEILTSLREAGRERLIGEGVAPSTIESIDTVLLRYAGSDTALEVAYGSRDELQSTFEAIHKQRFGFIDRDKNLVVEALQAESVSRADTRLRPSTHERPSHNKALDRRPVVTDGETRETPFHQRDDLAAAEAIDGPAVIIERTGTVVVEPGWRATLAHDDNLILERVKPREQRFAVGTEVDPVMLEIFNNLFMNIAEQMGLVLANTASSVNIKERLDFSCAIFDAEGELIANAPHMPVHLGSMSESIKTVIRENGGAMHDGDAFALNAPYNGGTHLPDVTIIRPVFLADDSTPAFYVASRGHHADIGGITPGSMPSHSKHVDEEGILLDNVPILSRGVFEEQRIRDCLADSRWPARNPDTNIADFKAQIAACEKGAVELLAMVEQFGIEVVKAYMRHVQDNAEECVRRVLHVLKPGHFRYELDDGHAIEVDISVDNEKREAVIDFSGTSAQHPGNYNAPAAVTVAAVLYVFRCLVDDDIPLNAGCLKPLRIINPQGCMVNPRYPAAVVAGNVETSQYLVDTLLGALGVAAGSQGTMNNFTWGNERYQYYETICGGSGATARSDGVSAVHTHMTNSRLTDPEVLEWRFPVLLESFAIRHGSGGGGRHRGGDGTVRRLRFLEPMSANILAGHRRVPPYGLEGGESGATGVNYVLRADGSRTDLSHSDSTEVDSGDVFVIETPGGGGYGAS
jgi:5-oxoprolinase (ATP-hydrolysing)